MFKFKQFVEEVESYELNEEDFLTLPEEEKNLYLPTEKISFQLRQKRSRLMKKLRKTSLKIGANKWKRKLAGVDRLKTRARKTIRRLFTKKFARGKAPTSVGQKDAIHKRLKSKGIVKRMGVQTVQQRKKTRKADMQRKQGGAGKPRSG